MIDLKPYAEIMLVLSPIVIPILVFLVFMDEWRRMSKAEIITMVILTILFTLYMMWASIAVSKMAEY